MALNGLLLLTSSTLSSLTPRSRVNLSGAKKYLELVDKKRLCPLSPVLYVVQWLPAPAAASSTSSSPPAEQSAGSATATPTARGSNSMTGNFSLVSSLIYSQGNAQCPSVDLRFLTSTSSHGLQLQGRPQVPIDLVLVEGSPCKLALSSVQDFVKEWFTVTKANYSVQYLSTEEEEVFPAGDYYKTVGDSSGDDESSKQEQILQEEIKTYDVVAVGGTFDRMHNAHKILITEAVLRAKKEIIVGVTSDEMIKSKFD
jgi:hypothetical protein